MKRILEMIRINIEAIDDFLSFKMMLSLGKIILVVLVFYSATLFVSYAKTLYKQSMHSLDMAEKILALEMRQKEDRALLDKLVNDCQNLPSKK